MHLEDTVESVSRQGTSREMFAWAPGNGCLRPGRVGTICTSLESNVSKGSLFRGFLLPFIICHRPYITDFFLFVFVVSFTMNPKAWVCLALAKTRTLPSWPERRWSGQCPIYVRNTDYLLEMTVVCLLFEANEQLRISI